MYPGPFKPVPMGFQYPPPQPASSLYQAPYAGYNAFVSPAREQSVPASARPNPQPTAGPYAATPTRRHSKHSRPAQCQHYEYCSNRESKCKRYQRQPCGTPNGAADQSLYSDEVKTSEELHRSPSPRSKSHLKPEEVNTNDLEQKLQGYKHTANENSPAVEELPNTQEYHKRKSRSKRRVQHRHGEPAASSQKRAHHPPLYNSHYQMHDESSRRGDDGYYKQGKRPTRAPHEDNRHIPPPPHADRAYSSAYSPYSPYQPLPSQPGYYTPGAHYNQQQQQQQPPPPPPRPNVPGISSPFEREIQRLRVHIHALENELHNLQRKINKTTLNQPETGTPDDFNFKKHRTKRQTARSPRQTPVIVEINNSHGEHSRDVSPKKPHQHRSGSHVASQNGRQHYHQPSSKVSDRHSKLHNHKAQSQSPKAQEPNPCECSCAAVNHASEPEVKPVPIPISKQPREETAIQLAQLAHAAAARVQARQHVPPPPPVQHQFTHVQDPLPPHAQPIRDLNGPHPPQPNPTDLNHNQSNNNEIYNLGERNNRSAEKILDAFERFYKNIGRSSTTPVKVKYIPGETNCNHCHQRNPNNNNNNNPCPATGRISQSSSSTSSSSERVVVQECKQKTTYSFA